MLQIEWTWQVLSFLLVVYNNLYYMDLNKLLRSCKPLLHGSE